MIVSSGGHGADFGANSQLCKYRPDLIHLPSTNGEHCTGDLDTMVCDTTSNRQEGNLNFKQLMAQHTATKKLMSFDRNRLNQVFNPQLALHLRSVNFLSGIVFTRTW